MGYHRQVVPGYAEQHELEVAVRTMRIGHEQRERAKAHLHDMFGLGYLPEEVHAARCAATDKAQTQTELDLLLSDIPAPAGTSKISTAGWMRQSFNRYPDAWITGVTGVFIMIMIIIGGTAISVPEAVSNGRPGALGVGVQVIGALLAFTGCITAACIAVEYSTRRKMLSRR